MLLDIEQASKKFGGLLAVDDLTMGIEQGEIVGLIGPNGAGKTTVFEMVSGFLRLTSGRIFFESNRIDGLQPHEISNKDIARSFQSPQVSGTPVPSCLRTSSRKI